MHVQIWDAYQAGDERRARDIFNMLLPQINLIMAINLTVCKEILVRRGVFKSANMRIPGSAMMDAEDERERQIRRERGHGRVLACVLGFFFSRHMAVGLCPNSPPSSAGATLDCSHLLLP